MNEMLNKQLLAAAKKGEVRRSIEVGADVNTSNINGETPLHLAALIGCKESIKILLDKGANVNAVDKDGFTPTHFAAREKHKDVIKSLVKKVVDVNIVYKNTTLLGLATLVGCKESVEILLDKGANVNAVDKNGRTPLCWAVQDGHKEIVEILLDEGANINAVNKDGYTLLHEATQSESEKHKDVVKLLLKKGANVNVANKAGFTPLHFAAVNEDKEIVGILLDKGADINAVDKDGRTPLNWAISRGSIECTVTLIKYILLFDHEEATPDLSLEGFWDQCKSEVEKMKGGRIARGITFYNILADKGSNELAPHTLVVTKLLAEAEVEEGSYRNQFPIYANDLKRQLQIWQERVNAIDAGAEIIPHCFALEKFRDPAIKITEYLSNVDIVNLERAYVDHVNRILKFEEIVKNPTNGKVKSVKMNTPTFDLKYSEDSKMDVAEIIDRARDLGLTRGSIAHGRDVIRSYTDLADDSDIALIFCTSLGELEVNLYPDKQDKDKIIVEVSIQPLWIEIQRLRESIEC